MPIVFKAGVKPPPTISYPVQVLVYGLRFLSTYLGGSTVTITDWYRTPTENLALEQSVANSQHLAGTAVDVRNDAAGELIASLWRRIGGEVVDKRATSQPHWHLELPD